MSRKIVVSITKNGSNISGTAVEILLDGDQFGAFLLENPDFLDKITQFSNKIEEDTNPTP